MNEPIFLFDGGNYKRGTDDERIRVPLAPHEIDLVFYDPHVPYDTDNSIRTELNMAEYADMFCQLTVGDEIYVGIVPDAALYRGIWAMGFNVVKDFEVEFDLVRMRDVWNAMAAGGNLKGIRPAPMQNGPFKLPYTFSDGVGYNTPNAMTMAKLPWSTGSYDDYRNNDALKFAPIDPSFFAQLGEAMYIRMTVKKMGEFSAVDPDGCCNKCHKKKFPVFQVGCVYDRLCVDKQRWVKYCNCDFSLCRGGCDCPPSPDVTYNAVRVIYQDSSGKKLRPDEIVRVYPGETKQITPPAISGYTTPAAQSATSAMTEITFTYNQGATP